EQDPDAKMKAGYFEWETSYASGQYYFQGVFDPATRAVRWTGYSIQNRNGTPTKAVYEAVLSADGLRFENGRWSGGISVPGTWTPIISAICERPASGVLFTFRGAPRNVNKTQVPLTSWGRCRPWSL